MSDFRADRPPRYISLPIHLAEGDAALLRYVRAHTDAEHVLAAIPPPGSDTGTGPPPTPSARAAQEPGRGARDRVRVLALTGAVVLHRVHRGARLLTADVGEFPDLDGVAGSLREQISDLRLADDLDSAVEIALDLDDALDGGLADDLAALRAALREIVGSGDSAPVGEFLPGFARESETASGLARSLVHGLFDEVIDVSGLDLGALDPGEPDLPRHIPAGLRFREAATVSGLAGVVWDQATRWPRRLERPIIARSDELWPGVFRVRGRSERAS